MAKLNPEETTALQHELEGHLELAVAAAERLLDEGELAEEDAADLEDLVEFLCDEEEDDFEPEPAA